MLAWLAHFIERHLWLHRLALRIWRLLPPKLAGFLRGLLTTNWTVGAVALIMDGDAQPPEVLLVKHSYRSKGVWGLPGGALESRLGNPRVPHASSEDDVLESTLRREVFEELGIDIHIEGMMRIDAVPFVPEEPGPYRLDFFYRCSPAQGFASLREGLASGRIRPRSPEIANIALVPLNRLGTYDLYSSDARFLSEDLPRLHERVSPDMFRVAHQPERI